MWREAVRRGFPRARRRVVLGDGAAWIWNICREHFPGGIQIVDLYHSKEHLWAVARQLHPGDQTRREAWAEAQCAALEDGRLDEVLATLRSATGCEEALKCAAYIQGNRQRMRYDAFRAAGLCVGSGVLEAGCKSTVCTRLKRPGMHWTVAGANASSACVAAFSAAATRTTGPIAPPQPSPLSQTSQKIDGHPVLTGKPFSIASSPTVHHGTLELASNLQPIDYESAALTIELSAQSNRVSALIRLCRPTIGRPRG